ncbi:hydantoinase/oxoprolinase family protein [Streptomyces iconiensis]|uniref:Hydantoinase/oxoprolinase family protein n=1 Tax=Streptomyces iconiensis TaxID=1384038 RepID=A0ABT7A6L3_9ACTN|nr:hydantoinase/oxoprolinase family protein [Streptomyces iconiensis]MDJ1136983.1 hydantoinase/oxoprolinase family protein [Streptomyces iconiensis]
MTHSRALRVGVDIGGTFTDMAILDDSGIVAVGKTLTTHSEPAAAVEDVLRQTLTDHRLDPAAITTVVHGTTLVTNALIERRGARTALLTTEGFRDVVEMGREHRYELYDLALELPRPLVPRHLRFGVSERVLADGSVDTPLDTAAVKRLATELSGAGVEAVAVCFLHSHTNGAHERQAREIIRSVAPELRVALSSEVNPEIREYERASTTLANVYVQQLVETYLEDLRARLRGLGLRCDPLIMLSNGGVAAVDVARRFPIRMLESGPAGGALGAVAFGREAGRPDQIAFDMGGTTAKLCMIEAHRPLVTHTFEVDRVYRMRAGSGLPVRAPVIDMIEIGTGGGSIARVSPLGLITVGPDSAGSEPGPVSYGRGGTHCTVTDADVVLGYLDPHRFLGGDMALDADAAYAAVKEQIADPLGITVAEAAWGIHATADESMANAARVHAIERGQDPARLPLFVSGGNGPLHGPGVAAALGSPSLVAPPAAGVLSALGFLSAPMSIDIVRSRHATLSTVEHSSARDLFAEMEHEGAEVLAASGVDRGDIVHERTLEMRFAGQGNEIEVPVPHLGDGWRDALAASFAEQYRQRFGTVAPRGVETEILTWRVASRGPDPRARLHLAGTRDGSGARTGERDAYFPAVGGYVSTGVHDRYRLAPGTVLEGPALVQERESTLVVPPGARCTVTEDSSILVEFTPAPAERAPAERDPVRHDPARPDQHDPAQPDPAHYGTAQHGPAQRDSAQGEDR